MISHRSRIPAAAAALLAATLTGPAGAQEATSDATGHESGVRATVDALYAAISFAPGEAPDWVALEELFLDGANVLLPYDEAEGPTAQSASEFVAFFQEALQEPAARANGFHEHSAGMEITVFGRVAQVVSVYEARDTADQEDFRRRGVDFLQLARTPEGWRILSLTTDFERPGHALTARLRARTVDRGRSDGDAEPLRFLSFPEMLESLAESGHAWRGALNRDSLRCGIYRLQAGAEDEQPVHADDEVYFVVEGRAHFEAGDVSRAVGPGDVIFVAAGQRHRFTKIEEDLALWVSFGKTP